jgi:uncharacterized protein
MTPRIHALNWFELHVTDFDRAKRFYEAILNTTLHEVPAAAAATPRDWTRMAVFPYDAEKGVGGSITHVPHIPPGPGGTVVYLNVHGDLDAVIARIPAAGGAIVKPKTSIGPHGFIGLFRDTEGNVVGLHSS